MKDVIIIGGGPIGIACALECKKRKWNYLIIEKGALTNSLFNYPKNMTFFSTSEKLEIDNIPFISKNSKPNRDEALEYYRRVATSNAININLFETVKTILKAGKNFEIKTDKTSYKTKKIILATGFYDIPNLLNVPGEDLPKVTHYYKEAHPYAMQNIVVVGASNSSVDAALEIYRKGGNVTMIIRGEDVGKRVKYWVRPDIINRIEEGSIKAYFNSEITKITKNEVLFKSDKGIQSIPNDFVVALTGYKPNFNLLNQIGIAQSNDEKRLPKYNSETMETNIEGVYLAGVICGGMETHKWFIENSRIHAKQIATHIEVSFNY
ncbi:YpdA family putative bacillithiol disulfide reductase [Hyunsoonleella pacifica]|uniref:YpdA family putative bacillithiol disulfide reductase n=1 Tax=Hyunsoonleella pacifica TaxID=1080224 RepID=A0A4Q9FXV4_9FLAO|nr:YpdA family putative bacillithiol disulfide reductase [Hyunsoonleella pacifica]TBN19072.1 YpdA family putative bacillithiol disulfide reductase [Hyunsoonleella pacifica]GGD07094.1 pyridine nucleotide-disulfide oxidoreductase [Hyunsoonleella pacifica]